MPDGEAILDGVHGAASLAAKRIMRKDSRPLFVVLDPFSSFYPLMRGSVWSLSFVEPRTKPTEDTR